MILKVIFQIGNDHRTGPLTFSMTIICNVMVIHTEKLNTNNTSVYRNKYSRQYSITLFRIYSNQIEKNISNFTL